VSTVIQHLGQYTVDIDSCPGVGVLLEDIDQRPIRFVTYPFQH